MGRNRRHEQSQGSDPGEAEKNAFHEQLVNIPRSEEWQVLPMNGISIEIGSDSQSGLGQPTEGIAKNT
jgi:hypothetical protein